MPEYTFEASARWTGARRGIAAGKGAGADIEFGSPPEFQGESGKWTPEHFFTAAIASCFVSTFRAIAEFSKFEFAALEVAVKGVLEKEEGGFRFTRVVVMPKLTMLHEEDRERALRLLRKAERGCLISRSVNAQIALEPTIVTGTAAQR
jgi:peroxiredoxin-like protein